MQSLIDSPDEWGIDPYVASVSRKPGKNGKLGDIVGDLTLVDGFGADDVKSGWLERAKVKTQFTLRPLLELLEVLSCSNVSHYKTAAPKMNKQSIRKGVLPFDSYHVLVIKTKDEMDGKKNPNSKIVGSCGWTQREHLRRGHIRTYPANDKRGILKIFIQSVVVNAGKDGGKIYKDYKV